MQLVVQPDRGIEPVLSAIDKAKKTIDVVIFRLDIKDVAASLETAVKRGVAVRALITHTNKGGDKSLRKLETRLLAAGVTVSRSAEDLLRYHGKMLIIDNAKLYVNGFNFTWLDVDRSRSFGVMTTEADLVKEAAKLFQADSDRQPYTSGCDRFIVSPQNSRSRLTAFIEGAKSQLFIYDPNLSDPRIVRLLSAKQAAGVDVRVIGKVGKKSPLKAEMCPVKRLHVRAMIRDGKRAFVGSQSLRSRELDRRREIGVIVREAKVVKGMLAVFEDDWAKATADKPAPEGTNQQAEKGDTNSQPAKQARSAGAAKTPTKKRDAKAVA